MIKNVWIFGMFLVGLSLVLYPWVDRTIQENKQNRLLTEWQSDRSVGEGPLDKVVLIGGTSPIIHVADQFETDGDRSTRPVGIDGYTMLGTISIPTIDTKEPILNETTPSSLKIGVGNVVPDRQLGQLGNIVLAGHRSRTQSKQFARLNELKAGDLIELETEDGRYTYSVTDMFTVKPDDLSVLDQAENEHILTLITCDPVKNPTHRLIVRAEMIS